MSAQCFFDRDFIRSLQPLTWCYDWIRLGLGRGAYLKLLQLLSHLGPGTIRTALRAGILECGSTDV